MLKLDESIFILLVIFPKIPMDVAPPNTSFESSKDDKRLARMAQLLVSFEFANKYEIRASTSNYLKNKLTSEKIDCGCRGTHKQLIEKKLAENVPNIVGETE